MSIWNSVTCPQCGETFQLEWAYSWERERGHIKTTPTLVLHDDFWEPSEAYAVNISCPHCDYSEELPRASD